MAKIGDLIVVGTYEEFVLGYTLREEINKPKKFSLSQTFATHTHFGSIRALAVAGKYLASGGADETIQLYDLEEQLTAGSLNHHNGTVNTLAFSADRSFLFSGGDDGVITAVQTGSWFVEKVWKSCHHGKAVTGLSVHPSGKLALSIGTDNRITTWNLLTGRRAFANNASSRCKNGWGLGGIEWSPDGSCYAVFMASHVEVYFISPAVVSHITCSSRVTSICFLQNDVVLIGEESGEGSIHKINPLSQDSKGISSDELFRFQAHNGRVKIFKRIGPVDGSHNAAQFVSACSSGVIRIWEWNDQDVVSIAEVDCDCRITCMEFVHLNKKDSPDTSVDDSFSSSINGNGCTTALSSKVSEHHLTGDSSKSHDLDRSQVSPHKKRKTSSLKQVNLKRKSREWVVDESSSEHSTSHKTNNLDNVLSVNSGKWTVSGSSS